MSISSRQEQILSLLQTEGHLSVMQLSKLTYASPSSIRRDLKHLEELYLLKRTHGGARPFEDTKEAPPLRNRMLQSIAEKRKIAKKAATLLQDGQTIMLDGSSTASFLVPYIAKHKQVILFTNSMSTAMEAIRQGITTHCLGGEAVGGSAVLCGSESYRRAAEIYSDIFFFSSKSIDRKGVISDPTESENYLRQIMLTHTQRSVFLCDSQKFNSRSLYTLTDLDHVDIAVFDEDWRGETATCHIL